MATITYRCNICKRTTEIIENIFGINGTGACTITENCRGRLLKVGRNPNNVRQGQTTFVSGIDDYTPRKLFFKYTQSIKNKTWQIDHFMGVLPVVVVFVLNDDGSYSQLENSQYTVNLLTKDKITLSFNNDVAGQVHLLARETVNDPPILQVPPTPNLQATVGGEFTFAFRKYILTNIPESIEEVNSITLEIEVIKPNSEPFICYEEIFSLPKNPSPWVGWNEILSKSRKNMKVRSKSIFDFITFDIFPVTKQSIPEGTRLRFLRIQYNGNPLQEFESRDLFILLANRPYTSFDKSKDTVIDVGEIYETEYQYFVYSNGEFFQSSDAADELYPEIIRVS